MRKLYQWIIDRAASPYAELWLAGLAFADGGLFPFPPHPLLGLMCLANPKKALRYGIVTTVASSASRSTRPFASCCFFNRPTGISSSRRALR